MKILFQNMRIIDEATDMIGSVLIDKGIITEVIPEGRSTALDYALLINGEGLGTPVLTPAFVDLHAHFRDPGNPEKETLESGSLAAATGGYGTVVCMANTNPVIDTPEKARSLKERSDRLGLIDLYPVISLTQGMEGKTLSEIDRTVRMCSEDGRDVSDDALLLAAFREAHRLGIPVSCHCDAGGIEAEAAKQAGEPREVWSRIAENRAVLRAITLGREASAHVHIAHVSTKEAVELIRQAKVEAVGGFILTCEAAPHHLSFTEADAVLLGAESYGRVNPPLRTREDRQALIEAVLDGTIDAIATDHAPHTERDKAKGAPGFIGLETGFSLCRMALVKDKGLSRLSALMSAGPARILGLQDRGRIVPGLRADLAVIDPDAVWQPESFRSRGTNTPVLGRSLTGKVLMTLHRGRIVFDQQN